MSNSLYKFKIAYIVNNAAFFVSHRIFIADAIKKNGGEVCLFTGQAASQSMERGATEKLRELGIPFNKSYFQSSSVNIFTEFIGLMQLIFKLRRYQPQLVHCASPKGILYGGIAARLCRTKALVLAVSGMGYIFTDDGKTGYARLFIRKIYKSAAKFAFAHPNLKIIVQNRDDYSEILDSGLGSEKNIFLISGSGVDLKSYSEDPMPGKEKIVLFPARILRDKGVSEFICAATSLGVKFPDWRFILAGAIDYSNPSAIPDNKLKEWLSLGCIEIMGHVQNMAPLFKKSTIVCLPSYREGMPKALMEGSAAGCAIITTDVIGCRDAVISGLTGDIVPPRDVSALTNALETLMANPQQCIRYGLNGRAHAFTNFSLDEVIKKTLKIYRDLIEEERSI